MDEDIRIMRALREALGADFKLMIDAHWNYTVAQAVKLAHRLEELDVEFLECPLNPENLAGYSELAATVSIPVTLGEADRTHWRYKDILDRNSCDIVQPDGALRHKRAYAHIGACRALRQACRSASERRSGRMHCGYSAL